MSFDYFLCNRKLPPEDLLALNCSTNAPDERCVDGPLRQLTLCDEDDNFMSAARQFDSGAGGRLDTVHTGAGDRHEGALSVATVNWDKPDSPVIRNDQSSATVAVINHCPEYSSEVGDALMLARSLNIRAWFRDDAPRDGHGPTRRPSRSRSCTSSSVVANSRASSFDAVGRGAIVSRYQPGGTRGVSNVPLALTTATLDSDPKPPNRWNSLTAIPLAGRPEELTTDPDTRAPLTRTSSIWMGAAPSANGRTDAASW